MFQHMGKEASGLYRIVMSGARRIHVCPFKNEGGKVNGASRIAKTFLIESMKRPLDAKVRNVSNLL
jgi:hypothetical protein